MDLIKGQQFNATQSSVCCSDCGYVYVYYIILSNGYYILMPKSVKKWIVKLRMWYADIRGHHGRRWDYEPGDYYMGRKRKK